MTRTQRNIFALALMFVMTAGAVAQQPKEQPKEQNRSFDGTPLDPFKEGARVRAKEQALKNYQELKEAAAELALLTRQLNDDVEGSGENVISARIFDRLDRIEKLTKRVRDKAKGSSY